MATQKERDALARSVKTNTKPATAASLQKKYNTAQAQYDKQQKTNAQRIHEALAKSAAMPPSTAKKAKYSHTVTLRADKMAQFRQAWDAAGSKQERQNLLASVQDTERSDTRSGSQNQAMYDRLAGMDAKLNKYKANADNLYKQVGKAIDSERVQKKQSDQKNSVKGRAASILGKAFQVIDTPRAAVMAAGHELGNEIARDTGGTVTYKGKKEKGGFSLHDFLGETFDPKKRLYGSDVVKGMGVKNKLAAGVAGFGVDVAADPLTYLGGVGIARHGAQAVGEEAATNLGKKLGIKAEEYAAEKIGAERAAALAATDTGRGKLIETALKNHPELEAYRQQGAKVVAEANRTGVSKLSRADIAEFLTRPGETAPQATRGVGFAGRAVPGTDVGPLAKLGEVKADVGAKLGETFRNRGGKILEGHAAEMAALKSGDPERALAMTQERLARGVVDSRASAAHQTGMKDFLKNTKDFTEEDYKLLPLAVEGDVEAQAKLAGRHAATQEQLAQLVKNAQDAGVNINKTEDYFPRVISEDAKAALEKEGIDYRQGSKGRRAFEKARSLTPGVKHTFLGEDVYGETAAAVRKQVDSIAAKKLGPDVAEFFSSDGKKVMGQYIRGITRRTAEAQGAKDLYNVGVGITASTTGVRLTEEGAKLKGELMHTMNMTAERATQLAERADQQEGGVRAMQSHLLSMRADQLEQAAAGHPLDSPLSDSVRKMLADSIDRGAGEDVTALEAQVTRLQANDAQRAVRRGNRATILDQEISDLRAKMNEAHAAHDPNVRANLMDDVRTKIGQVQDLENTKAIHQDRLNTIMEQALSGERKDVVMPEGFAMQDVGSTFNIDAQHREMLPLGTWKEVTPRDAYLDAAGTVEHANNVAFKRAKLEHIVEAANSAGNQQEQMDAVARLIDLAKPGQSLNEITRQVDELFPRVGKVANYAEKNKIRDAFERVHQALLAEEADARKRLEKAASFAERNPDTGLVEGPLYHGTPMGLPGDQFVDRIDTYAHTSGNLDFGGAYTTDDQTGAIMGGRFLAGASNKVDEGYMRGFRAHWADEVGPTWSKAYTWAPTDPEARLYPSIRPATLDEIPNEMADKMDQFFGGDHWMEPDFADAAGVDPTQAFLIDDAKQWLDANGIDARHDVLDQTVNMSELYGRVNEAIQTSLQGQHQDFGAGQLNDFRDHLYDDLGIKGLIRDGGLNYGHDVSHNHHIWFRPSEDLQLVGKADYSAALAQQKISMIEHKQATYMRQAERIRGDLEKEDARIAMMHEDYAKLQAKRAKYGSTAGEAKVSMRTQRAQDALMAAQDQADMARVYAADTADSIAAKVEESAKSAADIRQWLASDAPINAKMRAHLEDLRGALDDSVKWGRAHRRALEVGDKQLERLSAMERAAADTRAQLADLHQVDLEVGRKLGNLPRERYKELSDMMKQGLHKELSEGIGTPQEVADMLLHVEQRTDPDAMMGIMRQYDKVVGWLKTWQIATPGFIERNVMGGVWNNGFEDVKVGRYLDYIKARSAAFASAKGDSAAWDRFAAKNPEVADLYTKVRGIIGEGNVGHDISLKAGRNKIPNPLSRNNVYVRGMTHANEEAEGFLRGTLAMHVMAEGGTVEQAVAAINRVHFDYGDLSHTELGIKRVIPFYTWSRKNIPLQFQQLLTNPKQFNRYGVFTQEVNRMSNPDATTPSYFPELGAVRTPFTKGGGHVYATPDLPFNDLNTVLQSPKNAVMDVASMVTPVLKTPIEYAMGKQAFKGLDLTDKPVPIPVPAAVVKGLAPALEATGLAQRAGDGSLVMSQKNAYVLEQFAPMLARYRRMSGQGGDKQLGGIVSTLFGVGLQTNTKAQQSASDYYDNQAVIAKLKTQLQRDIIGQSPSRIKALYSDFNRTINRLTTQGK